jgi:hypothetical protein
MKGYEGRERMETAMSDEFKSCFHTLYFQYFVMPQTSILDLAECDFRVLRFFGLRPLIFEGVFRDA